MILLGFTLCSTLYILCNMVSVHNFPLSENMIVLNITPIVCLVLSYYMIGERLSIKEVICLTVAFVGVSMVTAGEVSEAASRPANDGTQAYFYVMLGI